MGNQIGLDEPLLYFPNLFEMQSVVNRKYPEPLFSCDISEPRMFEPEF